MRVEGLIKPFECFLFPAQPGVDKSDLVPPHSVGLNVLLQLRNGFQGRSCLTRAGLRVTQVPKGIRSVAGFEKFSDRFGVLALFGVDIAQKKTPVGRIDIERANSQDQRKRLVILMGEVIDEALGVE